MLHTIRWTQPMHELRELGLAHLRGRVPARGHGREAPVVRIAEFRSRAQDNSAHELRVFCRVYTRQSVALCYSSRRCEREFGFHAPGQRACSPVGPREKSYDFFVVPRLQNRTHCCHRPRRLHLGLNSFHLREAEHRVRNTFHKAKPLMKSHRGGQSPVCVSACHKGRFVRSSPMKHANADTILLFRKAIS